MENNLMGYKNDEKASHWDIRMMEEQVIGLLEWWNSKSVGY